ncbi:SDR family NAD(P)-dependent oxidoreductase [Pseudoalteromonas sp. SSM20]|uniref:SDR family NAD(P)-dependent oxidoreductase n=1 Tax=Pseudoalteromonas sp. SSM20 TaxID=3139394 RepID=UPI003BA9A29D
MKTVLITGASSGIGESLAKYYAQQGFKVFACGRNQQKLAALCGEFSQITPLVFDLNNKTEIFSALDKSIKLDHIILNAGTCEYIDNAKQFDGDLFARVINTNLISVGYCLEAWLPQLNSGGQLGLMSSSAVYVPLTRAEAYGASKAGVSYLAKTLSIDLASSNIGVSTIHPGFVETPLTNKNDFPMPSRITSEQAAEAIYLGMKQKRYDIHFPKRFTLVLKTFALLPFFIWRKLAIRMIK